MSDLSAATAATTTEPAAEGASGSNRSLWGDVRYELVRNPVFWVSAALVFVIVLMAFFPQLFASTSPNSRGACPLEQARVAPTWEHPFGYTAAGCDMWASLVWGTGKSVILAMLVVTGIVIIGVLSGTAAGWFGGLTDTVVSRITDIFFGLPFILGAIVFLAIFPTRNIWTISLVLTIFGWTSLTRVMRGSVISTKQRDFVDAARALGATNLFIIRKHVLANSIAPVIVLATIALGSIILLVAEGQNLALAGFWHLLVYPCAFIVVTVLAFIMLGDVLRDALDPRSR
jgi:ABC-type dipeptide/oligopeptide/nickel transport system permease subunit